MNNAKQYQLEASGDAALSFEKGGVSFDNLDDAGKLIDRKYGHGSSIFKYIKIMDIKNGKSIQIINQLREKLLTIKESLKNNNNSTYRFFEKRIVELNKGDLNYIESILGASTITQYGGFSYREEKLFREIWAIMDELKRIVI